MKTTHPIHLLEEAAQIQRMERGKLSVMREGPNGTHFKLQAWEKGKNVSRHVSGEDAQAVQEALEGYQKFQDLTQQYAQQIIDTTRAEHLAHSKKKKYHRRWILNHTSKKERGERKIKEYQSGRINGDFI